MQFYLYYSFLYVGRNSVVYIAAGYGLDGPGIKFSAAYSTSYTIGTGPFPGVKPRVVMLTTYHHLATRLKKA